MYLISGPELLLAHWFHASIYY